MLIPGKLYRRRAFDGVYHPIMFACKDGKHILTGDRPMMFIEGSEAEGVFRFLLGQTKCLIVVNNIDRFFEGPLY